MSRLVLTELAENDLIGIWVHIAPDNEAAADRIVEELHATTYKLLRFPLMGRTADHLHPGARAFVHGNYLIVYRVMDYGIAVLRVAHGAQDLELLEYPAPPEE